MDDQKLVDENLSYGVTQKYCCLLRHQAIPFCFIVWLTLDYKYLLVDLDFDTSTIQIW